MTESESETQARLLAQALPYMQRYENKTIVVKYGGHAMGDVELGKAFAADIALLGLIADAPLMIATAAATGAALLPSAQMFLEVGDCFRLDDIVERAQAIRTADDYDRLAVASATAALLEAQRTITLSALALDNTGDAGSAGLQPWLEQRKAVSDRVIADLSEIAGAGDLTVSRMTVAASRLSDLARMAADVGGKT